MTLKLLNAHSSVHVPLQITEREDKADRKFVEDIQANEISFIPAEHPYALRHKLNDRSVIVIKQGTWAPRTFEGFALIRQPMAFVSSMLVYNRKEGLDFGLRSSTRYRKTHDRLKRWASQMSPQLVKDLEKCKTPVEALCTFYVHRVGWILDRNIRTIKYENLVTEPAIYLREICEELHIEYEDGMLQAHESYEEVDGHGMNDLSRKTDTGSLNKWERLPTQTKSAVVEFCGETAKRAGYNVTRANVSW